ncbi:oxidoreductase [Alteromonas gracilis]|uniref:oxidoreductase n=1 Tax=Alteromonas gracilis TaxID=1479524 RepID=UPI0030CB58DD
MKENFFVIAREPGAQNPAIPTWAAKRDNAFLLDSVDAGKSVNFDADLSEANAKADQALLATRNDIAEVPGAYQLLNVFSEAECSRFIETSEALGYLKDAAVSLPREIRHNDNVTIVVDDATERRIWQRVSALAEQHLSIFDGKKPLGINTRFRFYRYQEGDYFKFHIDGDWPGSKVIGNNLVTNAYSDRYSKMTFLILLNDDFEGGETQFLVNADKPGEPARRGDKQAHVNVRTPTGGVLLFPHGRHPLHCLHSSTPITKGVKYIIRTDMLFEL